MAVVRIFFCFGWRGVWCNVVRFEAVMVVKIQVEVFWLVMLCTGVVGYQHFRVLCSLQIHLHQINFVLYWSSI